MRQEDDKQMELFPEMIDEPKDGYVVGKCRRGSHFPMEVYDFGDDSDKLSTFVTMLKDRGYYIGEDNHVRTPKGSIASKLMTNGYYMTSAFYDKKCYYFMEHRVIWCWHNGPIPEGMVVNHKDYNKWNNDISNLEIMTQKENVEYSRPNFNPRRGYEHPKSAFTEKQAKAIKTLANVIGWKNKDIASIFNTNCENVSRIKNGRRYPNVIEANDIMEIYPIMVDFTRNKSIGLEEELKNYSLGLAGECGELLDMVKKCFYHGKPYEPVQFILELGDILYYTVALALALDIDIDEILLNNNAKLLARYKDGFSVKDSLNRIEDKPHDDNNPNN